MLKTSLKRTPAEQPTCMAQQDEQTPKLRKKLLKASSERHLPNSEQAPKLRKQIPQCVFLNS